MPERGPELAPGLAPDLAEVLAALSDAMAGAAHPWWLIGSVAVALHGGDAGPIGDIDVVVDPRDMPGVLARTGAQVRAKSESALFRSDIFATWHHGTRPIEFMAGFRLCRGGTWHPVEPASRESVAIMGRALFVPSRAELVAMLRSFGRDKDLRRAEALERLAT